jgi:FKBP-type peptidyl-prolyl cis-trans isomerase 2
MHNNVPSVRPAAYALTAACALFLLALGASFAQEKKNVITAGKQVSFNYTLTSGDEELESNKGQEPLTYIQGSNQILPALEAGLEGLAAGDTKNVSIAAADAYGEVDPEAIQEVPLDQIPESAREVGAMLQAQGLPGPIKVLEIREEVAVLDFNHPLAGKELVFAVEIITVDDVPTEAPPPAQ